MINGMADLGAFLYSTDHLSDRELYSTLWRDKLPEEHPIVSEDFPLMTHIDLLGGWSERDIETYL